MADLFGEWELAQAQGLEGDLAAPGGVNLAGLPPGKKDQTRRNITERAKQGRTSQGGFATHPMQAQYSAFMQGFGPQAQANSLQGMINQTTNAWQDENDSRVAQAREMRRMEHEKEMERMRQETILRRLQMEQGMDAQRMRMDRIAKDRANGVLFSTNWKP